MSIGASSAMRPEQTFQRILRLFAAGSVFTADLATVTSGKVTVFTDWLDPTHTLGQSDNTKQVATPGADSSLNNALSVTFSGAQYYDSSRAASAWRYMHDGTGCWVVHVFMPTSTATTRCSLATRSLAGGAGDLGFSMHRVSTPNFLATNRNGGATIINATGGTPAANTPTFLDFEYKEGLATEFNLRVKSTSVASGNTSGAPASGDSSGTLRLGGTTAASVLDQSHWVATFMRPSVPTSDERTLLRAYIKQKYGVT